MTLQELHTHFSGRCILYICHATADVQGLFCFIEILPAQSEKLRIAGFVV